MSVLSDHDTKWLDRVRESAKGLTGIAWADEEVSLLVAIIDRLVSRVEDAESHPVQPAEVEAIREYVAGHWHVPASKAETLLHALDDATRERDALAARCERMRKALRAIDEHFQDDAVSSTVDAALAEKEEGRKP